MKAGEVKFVQICANLTSSRKAMDYSWHSDSTDFLSFMWYLLVIMIGITFYCVHF